MNSPAEIAAMCDEGIELFTRLKTLAGSADAFVRSLQDVLQGHAPARTLAAPNPPPNKRGRRPATDPGKPVAPLRIVAAVTAARPKRVVSEATRQRMREGQARRHRKAKAAHASNDDAEPGEAIAVAEVNLKVDADSDGEAVAVTPGRGRGQRRVTAEEKRRAAAFDAYQQRQRIEHDAAPVPHRMTYESRPRARRGDTAPINPMRLTARDNTPTLIDRTR